MCAESVLSDVFFFFNATATTGIYTLSLHHALPISVEEELSRRVLISLAVVLLLDHHVHRIVVRQINGLMVGMRSEEHTSELQSQFHLVCRLLLEKKKLAAGSAGRIS